MSILVASRALVGVVSIVAATACGTAGGAALRPETASKAQGSPAATPSAAPPSSRPHEAQRTHEYVVPPPVLVLEGLTLGEQPGSDAEAARTRAAFARATPVLERCAPGAGGIIRLTLTGDRERARYAVQPSTSLGPTERRCVLEALSTVEIEGISGDASPSARPSGFTAHLRIEW
jgi:hypothetical protein